MAAQNFHHLREAFCEIWHRDLIFGKKVDAYYVDILTDLFKHIQFEGTEREKVEELKRREKEQKKSNDIKKEVTHTRSKCFVP